MTPSARLGFTSDAARGLAGLMAANQGRSITWIAHSGGGVALAEGMRYARDNLGVTSLSGMTTIYQAGANNRWATSRIERSLGMAPGRYEYSSLDAVPTIIGFNGNPLQMIGSVIAVPWLSSEADSPHTFPSVRWGWETR